VRDAVWIVGVSMTKFGRYPDKDIIDSVARQPGQLGRCRRPSVGHRLLAFGTTSETTTRRSV